MINIQVYKYKKPLKITRTEQKFVLHKFLFIPPLSALTTEVLQCAPASTQMTTDLLRHTAGNQGHRHQAHQVDPSLGPVDVVTGLLKFC